MYLTIFVITFRSYIDIQLCDIISYTYIFYHYIIRLSQNFRVTGQLPWKKINKTPAIF